MNKFLLTLLLFSLCENSYSQENRYMVFFRDKNNSTYSLDRPEEFLSVRSIDRRSKHHILLNESDLPVNVDYINGLKSMGAQVFYPTKWFNGVLVVCADSLTNAITSLSYVKNIKYVAPGPRPELRYIPSDSDMIIYSQRIKELMNATQNDMLGVDVMHKDGYDGNGIMIAVLDAGFIGMDKSSFFTHLFTDNKIAGERDFVSGLSSVFTHDTHGTEVMSTMAAYKSGDYEGISYNSDFVLCITEDDPTEYKVEEYNWLFGAEYADSLGADIINSSLGYNVFDDSTMDYTYADMNGKTAVSTRAADMAADKGMLVVVSVGNEGNDFWGKLVAPADGDSVLSVGAVNNNLNHAYFSSYGPSADGRVKPEVAALGSPASIVSALGTVTYGDGTSYSAPLISGLASGIWQAYPDLSNMELLEVIEKGSSNYDHPDSLIGYGIPDFKKIQSLVTALSEDIPQNAFKVYPNPVEQKRLFIEYDPSFSGNMLDVTIYNASGTTCYQKTIKMIKESNKAELNLENLNPGIYILSLDSVSGKGKVKLLVP